MAKEKDLEALLKLYTELAHRLEEGTNNSSAMAVTICEMLLADVVAMAAKQESYIDNIVDEEAGILKKLAHKVYKIKESYDAERTQMFS